MPHIALSTIALTAYNCIQCGSQLGARAQTAGQLAAIDAVQALHPGLDADTMKAALDELVTLKWVSVTVTLGSPVYDSLDPKARLVTNRDRSDAVEADDGTITGGWRGWEVQNGAMRLPIEEAIR